MHLLSLKLARRDAVGRYTSLYPFIRKAALYGLITFTIVGTIHSAIIHARGDEVPSERNSRTLLSKDKETRKDCVETKPGSYDCTDEATKNKAKGVTWHAQDKAYLAVFQEVCQARGVKSPACPHHLLGMAKQESGLGQVMVGDGGHARGWFQISNLYNNVPDSCSLDLRCSAEWTLDRMIRHGYKKNPKVAVMSHNGTPGTKTTKRYLALVLSKGK